MKKRIIGSVLLIVAVALFSWARAGFVAHRVILKEEACFSAAVRRPMVQEKNRKLTRHGELTFECNRIEKARPKVEEAIARFNGYLDHEALSSYGKYTSLALTIRVPAEHFDAMIAAISTGSGRVVERSIRIKDVTDDYLDTETRLAVKHELEARYRSLLGQAENVKEILAIEEQIGTLREEIESAEAHIRRYDDRIAYSTLEIRLNELTRGIPPRFAKHFRNGVGNGWQNLVWFIVGLVNIWPFLLIIGSSAWAFSIHRHRKAKPSMIERS